MRRNAGQVGILEQLRPLPGEASERRVIVPAGEDIVFGALLLLAASLETFQHWKADWTHRCPLFAVGEAQATALDINLSATETNDLAAPATRKGNNSNNFCRGLVPPVLDCLPEDASKRAILLLVQSAGVDLVLRLSNAR
jgi:hypothetical protein